MKKKSIPYSSLTFKAIMFGSLANGGHLQQFQCEQLPELTCTNEKKTRKHNWVKTFTYNVAVFHSTKELKTYLLEMRICHE